MSQLAIIGGAITQFTDLKILKREQMGTPFGLPSAEFVIGELSGYPVIYLSRHGNMHTIAPHKINYRANLWGLKQMGVKRVIAIAVVSSLTNDIPSSRVVIPDQLIDYSYGRMHTFFEDEPVEHIDFSQPYSQDLRTQLSAAAAKINLEITAKATYGCTQGPRLSSVAEAHRMKKDGCHVTGMTGMPEAALAMELGMEYATVCVVASQSNEKAVMDNVDQSLQQGMANVVNLLNALVA